MLKLSTLLKMTPYIIIKRANRAMPRIVASSIDTDEIGKHKKVFLHVYADDGPRNVVIKFYNYESDLMHSDVYVWCSCPFFKYNLEVALSARGSSSVINSNGKYPHIKNPQLHTYLCKHLFAAVAPSIKVKAIEGKESKHFDDHELKRLLHTTKKLIPKK